MSIPITLSKIFVSLAVALVVVACGDIEAPDPAGQPERVLSLSPGITEVIYELGAEDLLVGRTQFTTYPDQVKTLPSVGPGLTPDYEAIVRLNPDLLVTEKTQSLNAKEISVLAHIELLPWLTFDEMMASVDWLGETLEKQEAAAKLNEKMRAALGGPRPADPPTLLLTLGQPNESAPAIWFAREDSLHGTVIEAAGFKNAVASGIYKTPSLPLEALLKLNPEYIIVLLSSESLTEETKQEHLSFWNQFSTLTAVENQHVFFLASPAYFSTGPRILTLVDALQAKRSGDSTQ